MTSYTNSALLSVILSAQYFEYLIIGIGTKKPPNKGGFKIQQRGKTVCPVSVIAYRNF
jgi:hypothetical protein